MIQAGRHVKSWFIPHDPPTLLQPHIPFDTPNPHRVGVGQVAGVVEPRLQVLVGATPRNVVHEKGAGRTAVVAARHRTETLLASRVPNLQLNLLAAHL